MGDVVGSGATIARSSSQRAISLTATTQSLAWGAADGGSMLVGVNLNAAAAPESDTERAPVNCVVVSDVSGSMNGNGKIGLLKETATMLLDEFAARDSVGLVTFDSNVKEPLKLASMSGAGKTRGKDVVSKFRAGSQTNLSGGLFAGIQQLLDNHASGDSTVKTVLLMTDGEANCGLRTSDQIVAVLSNMLEGSGISIHTFGYGSNHNSDLLRAIATAGNGSYYYVEGVDDIRNAFGDCLGGVLSVVAQNIELTIEAVNGAKISKVHHRNAKTVEEGKIFTVNFADLYGEEQRDVLADVVLPKGRPVVKNLTTPEAQVVRCRLRYVDLIQARPAEAATVAALLRPAGSLSAAKRLATYGPDNAHLELQSLRLRVASTLELARRQADSGNLSAGRALVTKMQAEVKEADARLRAVQSSASASVDSAEIELADSLLSNFSEDLRDCLEGMVDQDIYSRVTSKKMAYMSAGHMNQRCAESRLETPDMMQGELLDGMGSIASAPISLRKNAYRTKTKDAKAKKFWG